MAEDDLLFWSINTEKFNTTYIIIPSISACSFLFLWCIYFKFFFYFIYTKIESCHIHQEEEEEEEEITVDVVATAAVVVESIIKTNTAAAAEAGVDHRHLRHPIIKVVIKQELEVDYTMNY
jgi:hypothetical protein